MLHQTSTLIHSRYCWGSVYASAECYRNKLRLLPVPQYPNAVQWSAVEIQAHSFSWSAKPKVNSLRAASMTAHAVNHRQWLQHLLRESLLLRVDSFAIGDCAQTTSIHLGLLCRQGVHSKILDQGGSSLLGQLATLRTGWCREIWGYEGWRGCVHRLQSLQSGCWRGWYWRSSASLKGPLANV